MAKAKLKPAARAEMDALFGVVTTAVKYSASHCIGSGLKLVSEIQEKTKAVPMTVAALTAAAEKWDETGLVHVTAKQPIFLPPPKDQPTHLPVVTIRWTFAADDSDQQSIRLKMISVDSAAKAGLRIASLHLDSPNDPPFAFTHLQYTQRALPEYIGFYHEAPLWLPSSYPRIPLPAASPAEALLCVLVSLYGGRSEVVTSALRESGKCEMMTRVVKRARGEVTAG